MKKDREYPKVYKTKEEAFEAKHNKAREFLKTVDLGQLEAIIVVNKKQGHTA